jgi:glycosidase
MKRGLFLFIAIALGACTMQKERIPESMPESKSAGTKLIIYQMMTRLFGNTTTTNKRYGTIEENGVGKFHDIDSVALREIRNLGVTHVWYTGVLEHALLTDYTSNGIPLDDADVVKGRAGSPYSIKDYYDVNPDLAIDVSKRMQEFEALINRTHQQDLAVIIDFVPNHVARAYHSDMMPEGTRDLGSNDDNRVAFKASNNFYYLPGQSFQSPSGYRPLGNNQFPTYDGKFTESPAKATGNDKFDARPGVDDWFEAVKLNYGVDYLDNRKTYFDPVPDTWTKMLDILIYWTNKNVDGFRCDMAEMVPVEFWAWAIPQVKAVNPSILFIAEIYNPAAYRAYIDTGRFDFLYDKVQLYDNLRSLMSGNPNQVDIPSIQNSLSGINHRMLHFLENHDEQRIASPFFAGDPWKAVPGMVVSATIDQGPVMIYFGQESGEPGAGDKGFGREDGRTTIYDYWGVPEHQKWLNNKKYDGGQLNDIQKQLRQFYGDILKLASGNPAIANGDYIDLTASNIGLGNFSDRYVVYGRKLEDENLVVVAGFSAKTARIKITLPPDAFAKFGFTEGQQVIGRDLLRSGTDVGLDNTNSFEVDVPPFSAYIFKLK